MKRKILLNNFIKDHYNLYQLNNHQTSNYFKDYQQKSLLIILISNKKSVQISPKTRKMERLNNLIYKLLSLSISTQSRGRKYGCRQMRK